MEGLISVGGRAPVGGVALGDGTSVGGAKTSVGESLGSMAIVRAIGEGGTSVGGVMIHVVVSSAASTVIVSSVGKGGTPTGGVMTYSEIESALLTVIVKSDEIGISEGGATTYAAVESVVSMATVKSTERPRMYFVVISVALTVIVGSVGERWAFLAGLMKDVLVASGVSTVTVISEEGAISMGRVMTHVVEEPMVSTIIARSVGVDGTSPGGAITHLVDAVGSPGIVGVAGNGGTSMGGTTGVEPPKGGGNDKASMGGGNERGGKVSMGGSASMVFVPVRSTEGITIIAIMMPMISKTAMTTLKIQVSLTRRDMSLRRGKPNPQYGSKAPIIGVTPVAALHRTAGRERHSVAGNNMGIAGSKDYQEVCTASRQGALLESYIR